MSTNSSFKKVSLLTILFVFFAFSIGSGHGVSLRKFEKKPKRISTLKTAVEKIKKDSFEKRLRSFIKAGHPSRMVGTKGHEKIVPFLIKEIKKIDEAGKNILVVDKFKPDIDFAIKSYQDDFKREIVGKYMPKDPLFIKWDNFTKTMVKTLKKFKDREGRNVIWEKRGSKRPDEILVIGANYDTIVYDKNTLNIAVNGPMPGADNNGSGVAVLLSLIELITEMDIEKTVRVVFFDFGELSGLGSRAFAKKYGEELKKSKNSGYVNLVMLGHDSKINDKLKKSGNMKVYGRKDSNKESIKDLRLAKKLIDVGRHSGRAVEFKFVGNGFSVSDHVNFWKEGIPAISFTQDWENDYNYTRHHTPDDFIETLNMKTLYNSFKFIAMGVSAWAFDIAGK